MWACCLPWNRKFSSRDLKSYTELLGRPSAHTGCPCQGLCVSNLTLRPASHPVGPRWHGLSQVKARILLLNWFCLSCLTQGSAGTLNKGREGSSDYSQFTHSLTPPQSQPSPDSTHTSVRSSPPHEPPNRKQSQMPSTAKQMNTMAYSCGPHNGCWVAKRVNEPQAHREAGQIMHTCS